MELCSTDAANVRPAPTPNIHPNVSNHPSLSAIVAPSGESLIVTFLDGFGNPTTVTQYSPNASETIAVTGAAGTFTVSFMGQTTGALPIGATAAAVQTALTGLSTIGAGNAAVTGLAPYYVTWTGALAGSAHPLMTVATSSLSATSSVQPTTAGTTSGINQSPTVGPNFSISGTGWGPGGSGGSPSSGYYTVATGIGQNVARSGISRLPRGITSSFSFILPPGLTPPMRRQCAIGSSTALSIAAAS